jgi:excisionase family DNA binding protein
MVATCLENLPPVLTRPDVADFLKLSKRTLVRMERDGRLPVLRFGRTIRYEREAIKNLLEGVRDGGRQEEVEMNEAAGELAAV